MENEDNWRHSFECAIPNQTLLVSLSLFHITHDPQSQGTIREQARAIHISSQ